MELRKIPLADIYPDENNPREDFGDIAALAESFDLNAERPGEPFTPPLVVADGGIYRIVDGERRYRAMASRGLPACHAYVCADMDEANAMAVMIATDDKQPLTELEKSRGVQQMLLLGVDPAKVDKVSRRAGSARVRRAMRAVEDAAEDMTLDRLLAIAELDDMPEAVEELARCREAEWERVADRWRRERENRELMDELRGKAAALSLELVDERPEGWAWEARVNDPDDLYDALTRADPDKTRRLAGVAAISTWGGAEITIYGEPVDAGDEPDPEEVERENRVKRLQASLAGSRKRQSELFGRLLSADGGTTPLERAAAEEFWAFNDGNLEGFAEDSGVGEAFLAERIGAAGLAVGFRRLLADAEPPGWLVSYAARMTASENFSKRAEAWMRWMDLLAESGYEASPDEDELLGLFLAYVRAARPEGEGGDDD